MNNLDDKFSLARKQKTMEGSEINPIHLIGRYLGDKFTMEIGPRPDHQPQ